MSQRLFDRLKNLAQFSSTEEKRSSKAKSRLATAAGQAIEPLESRVMMSVGAPPTS
jgi:hypothetical protein